MKETTHKYVYAIFTPGNGLAGYIGADAYCLIDKIMPEDYFNSLHKAMRAYDYWVIQTALDYARSQGIESIRIELKEVEIVTSETTKLKMEVNVDES